MRRVFRLTHLIGLLFLGLAITFFVFPFTDRAGHRDLIARWSGWLMRACGVHIEPSLSANAPDLSAAQLPLGYLVLANHVSWLDIFVINQHCAARFVAKAEISRWPLIGTLVARVGTVFIERGRRRAVQHVLHELAAHLQANDLIAVFPEGTISDGKSLLPFHGNLIQAAIGASMPVVPVGIRYRDRHGALSTAPLYIGEMTFFQSVWRIIGQPKIIAHLYVLDAINTGPTDKRQLIAARARASLGQALDLVLEDKAPETLRGQTT